MKKIIAFTMLLAFSLTACNGQNQTEKVSENLDTIKPKINTKVYKKYDEDGNLISVDSTYSYFYSNIENDSLLEQKFFKDFKFGFDDNFNRLDSIMSSNFFNDDLFKMHDFYTDDFFRNRFKMNDSSVEEIFKRMDSLKNSYYLKQNDKIKKQM